MMSTTFRLFTLMFIAIAGIGLAGCSNTWEGAGRDVESAGEGMQ